MIVLDATIVIAYLNANDVHHERAVALLTHHAAPYVMHTLTIAEVLVGPARGDRHRAAWRDLQDVGVRRATLDADEPLLLAQVRVETGLRMPDACVLAAAVDAAIPLATFDDRLASAARDRGLLVEG